MEGFALSQHKWLVGALGTIPSIVYLYFSIGNGESYSMASCLYGSHLDSRGER